MASRRRKGGDKLRLRAPAPETRSGGRRCSRRRAAAAGESGAGGPEDGRVAAAAAADPSNKSKAEESCLYKTPKRSLSSRSRLPTFSSPANDTDIQQEIFWDPHSPITHKLGNERKKQATSRCTVDISDIVNRIAPQDEKPGCSEGSLLGMWIGEDAIPCTPGVVKVRTRTKLNGTRDHKIKNTEEELMKLAKQFDRNQVELDIVQEQDDQCNSFIQTNSEAETLNNYKDDAQMKNLQSFLDEDSETPTVLSFKPVKESTGIPAIECQTSSQKSLDLEAEVALNALFDCSTQKCSGQLSQGLSAISLNNSFHESPKSPLVEEKPTSKESTVTKQHIAKEICQKQGSTCASESVNQIAAPETKNIPLLPKQSLTSSKVESLISSKPAEVAHDDFDDWDIDLLADDSFVMQISTPEKALSAPKKPSTYAFNGISKTKERTNTSNSVIGVSFSSKSNSIQYAPLKQNSKTIQDAAKSLSFQKPNNEMENSKIQTGFLHMEHDVKTYTINSTWKSAQNKVSDYTSLISVQSDLKNGMERIHPKCGPTSFPVKGSSSILIHSNPHRTQTGKRGNNKHNIFPQSSISANAKPNDLVKVVTCTGVANLKQAEMPKKCSVSFDDWNDPKFPDEVLDMFCEPDSLWDTNCEDDDLLYQVCDDVEKQTQNQDIKHGNKRAIIIKGASITSKSDADNSFTASKKGLPNHPLAQKISANQDTSSMGTPCTNSSKVADRLSTFGNVVNCTNSANPIAVMADVPTQHRYTHSQNYNKAVSANTTNSVPGKWYRSNSVPAGSLRSEIDPVNITNRCTNAFNGGCNQDLSHNTGKIQNNSCMNKMSVVPSKFTFKKINNSHIAVHVDPKSISIGGTSGIKVTQQGLEESKNQLNIPLHGKIKINQKPPFKRHLSESLAESTTAFVIEQKNRKCSQEEIERKKQEALARRKSRMQAFLKDT
ncbi:ewing's tumor-associated antigen 1 isoform X1 [Trachemys scripta elegans]|uniref:ewing's tumor-associated antigen 1 isoform X1 n=1 Tax=Trachemys scripta elegans TaxID=31138 RepID=UPI001554F68D|nr:ewing's tumor-associated antigen 1 isoform X1 [Trachemys scripta elegans]